jgi:DNA polymerase III subunit delta
MIVVIHGDDTFRSRHKLGEVRRVFEERNPGVPVTRLGDRVSFSEIRVAAQNASLFSVGAYAVLEDLSANKELAERVAVSEVVARAAQSAEVTLVFFERSSIAKNKTYASIVRAAGKNVFECKALTERAATAWFVDFFKKEHPIVSPAVISDVVHRCNTDMWQSYNELQKLRTYVGRSKPTKRDVEALNIGSEQAQLFPMLDALFSGKADEAFLGLQVHWLRGEHPHGISNMIERQLKILVLVKEQYDAGERSARAIAQKTGIHPFVVSKSLRVASRFSWPKLKELYARAESLDYKSKAGLLDPYLACELLSAAVVA